MGTYKRKSRFMGQGPAPTHGHRNSIPPESFTPVKPEADSRRGSKLTGIRHVKSQ